MPLHPIVLVLKSANPARWLSAQEPEPQYAGENQIDRDDVVQKPGPDEDQDAGDDGDDRLNMRDAEDHDAAPTMNLAKARATPS